MGNNRPRRALVLCGGASRGAVEVGFVKALGELGIEFDLIVGTSIGALNGAMLATGMGIAAIEDFWSHFNRWKAVRPNWGWLIRPKTQPGLFSLDPMRRILRDLLSVRRFEDLEVPLWVTTTELNNGSAVYWGERGNVIEPVVASMSIPGIFPPVILDGQLHVDGGIANNVPLDFAARQGACELYLIDCFCDRPCLRPPRGLVQVLMRSFSAAVGGKYEADRAHFRDRTKIVRVRPKFDNNVDLLDFSKSREFIQAGYEATLAEMDTAQNETATECCNGQVGCSQVTVDGPDGDAVTS